MKKNNPLQGIIYRHAPAPEEGQDRVFQTVQQAVNTAIWKEIKTKRDESFLWQWILAKDVQGKINDEMSKNTCNGNKVEAQDKAVIKYLSWKLWCDPLKDSEWLLKRFWEVIEALNFPYIRKNISTLEPWEVLGKFVTIRHGEKAPDGNLTSDGIQEAQQAGKSIKKANKKSMMPSGYFGVQQHIVQMIMMGLSLWAQNPYQPKSTVYQAEQTSFSTLAFQSLPKEWQVPYHTGEVTTFSLSLWKDFKKDFFTDLQPELQNTYLRDHLTISIARQGVTKEFRLADVKNFLNFQKRHNEWRHS